MTIDLDNVAIVRATRDKYGEFANGDGYLRVLIDPADQQKFLTGFPFGSAIALVVLQGDAALPDMADLLPTAEVKAKPDQRPFASAARDLWLSGFFIAQPVLRAIDHDSQFLKWVRTQPCTFAKTHQCQGDVVAAHVRRIQWGAGTGIKPAYAAIALCDWAHQKQHQHGEDYIAPSEKWEDARNDHVKRWAWDEFKRGLEADSMSEVDPQVIYDWAIANNVQGFLPEGYVNN